MSLLIPLHQKIHSQEIKKHFQRKLFWKEGSSLAKNLDDETLPLTPVIAVVGNIFQGIYSLIVEHNKLDLQIASFDEAVKFCFIIHWVSNIKYTQDVSNFWDFYEKYIIGLTNPSKKKAAKSKVLSLMKEIKSRLED